MRVNWAWQIWTLLILPQNKREKKRVKKEDKVASASVLAWHYSVLTLLHYIDERGFKYNDITATRKICTVVRSSSQKQVTITHYFSK
jgi:hypothetical protein